MARTGEGHHLRGGGGDARRRAALPIFNPPTPPQVLKVGTSSLINNDHQAINLTNLARICETTRDLMAAGK